MAWDKESAGSMKGAEPKPKKEVKEVHVRHSANGGHILTHKHTRPEHHPDEEHTTKGDDAMAGHMMDAMGSPNPGEAPGSAPSPGSPDMGPGGPMGAAAAGGTPPASPAM